MVIWFVIRKKKVVNEEEGDCWKVLDVDLVICGIRVGEFYCLIILFLVLLVMLSIKFCV